MDLYPTNSPSQSALLSAIKRNDDGKKPLVLYGRGQQLALFLEHLVYLLRFHKVLT